MSEKTTPKVSVTISTNRKSRTYTGDYAYVAVQTEDGKIARWEQEPTGWMDGLGLFYAGLAALRTVAEQQGNMRFHVAARAALDAMQEFDPSRTDEPKKKSRGRKKKESTDA